MRDELRRMALFGSGVAELTRHRAEQIVKDLVKVGDVRKGQASGVVKDLLDRSKQNRQEIIKLVRGEIRNQIEAVGVATKRDFERLERRVTRLEKSDEKGAAKASEKGAAKAAGKSATKAAGKSATKATKKTSKKKTAKKSASKTTERSSSTKAPVSEAAREAAAEASAGTE